MGLTIKQVPGERGVAGSPAYGFQSHPLRPVSLPLGSTDKGLGATPDLPKPAPSERRRRQQQQQRKPEQLDCPRCGSKNTKFCYYNNYNKSQPRHFCRACKRHWTKGGTLRNVPVGGARKNKRVSKLNSSTTNNISSQSKQLSDDPKAAWSTLFQGLFHPPFSTQNDAISSSVGLGPALMQISFASSNTTSTTTTHKSNDYNQSERVDTVLESAPTTNENSTQLWQNPISSSDMDVTNYWIWNDLDSLVAADGLSTIWDDTEIKF